MSHTKDLKRARHQSLPPPAAPQAEPPRGAFSISIVFDPQGTNPPRATVSPLDEQRGAHIDDVLTALRVTYEQLLMQKGAMLLEQQMRAAAEKEKTNGDGNASA